MDSKFFMWYWLSTSKIIKITNKEKPAEKQASQKNHNHLEKKLLATRITILLTNNSSNNYQLFPSQGKLPQSTCSTVEISSVLGRQASFGAAGAGLRMA